MDIMINRDIIKSIRKEKSWSQDQLACIAGISIRTLQRIEREGKASLESRKALASALDLSPNDLLMVDRSVEVKSVVYGYSGVFIGAACSYIAVTYSLYQGQSTGFEAGITYGIVAALAGLSCSIMGYVDKRSGKR